MRYRSILWLLVFLPGQPSYAQLATYTAAKTQLPLERWFDGTVAAVNQATVSAETSARVQELLFDVGDSVPAGAVILRLVSTEQQEHLNQTEAALAEAMAILAVETRNYERSKEMLERRLISQAEFDQANGKFTTARARLTSAEATLKVARQRLSYTEVRAPYGGVVSARHVETGEAVNPGTPLMSGFDPGSMRVEVDIPQVVAGQVRALQAARVVSASGSEIIPSKIILFPIADPATNTVRVRLELPPDTSGLYPGQFIKVAFTTGNTERLLIPASSLVFRSEVTGLYVLNDTGLHLRQVRAGNRFGDQVEILAGLVAGENIAMDPVAASIAVTQSAHHD